MDVKIHRKIRQALKIVLLSATFFALGAATSVGGAKAATVPAVYNGQNPNTNPSDDSLAANGLSHKVWLSVTDTDTNQTSDSNYAAKTEYSNISKSPYSIINYANSKNLTLHMMLTNTGTSSLNVNELLNLPLDSVAGSNDHIVYAGNDGVSPTVSSGANNVTVKYDYSNDSTDWSKLSRITIRGSIAGNQTVTLNVPLKVLPDSDGAYNTGTFYYGMMSYDGYTATDIYGRARVSANGFNANDHFGINGTNKYLVTYRTVKDGVNSYWQAADIQNLMPAIKPADIVVNDFGQDSPNNPNSSNNDFPYVYSGGNFYVISLATLKDANGNNWAKTLEDHGYGLPTWGGGNFFGTYNWNYTGKPGTPTPNDGSQWLNKNGIGGINLQILKVIDVNWINDQDQLNLTPGTKWNPKNNVKIFNPDGQYQVEMTPTPDVTITSTRPLKADGTLDTSKTGTFDVTYTFNYTFANGTKKTYTKTIHVNVQNSVPNNGGGSSSNTTPTTTNNGTSTNNPVGNGNFNNGSTTTQPAVPTNVTKKGTAVYATKGIYMYKNANFKKSQRIAKYPKAKRVNRPMFVVTGSARSTNGTLRYKVRDVNHGTKTANKVGYITASRKYVVNVYYKTMPKNKQITVISKKGVHAYKSINLSGKARTYKNGKHLRVKKIVKHNLTTRYQLSNGYYVTANKKLVIQGNY